MSVESAKKFMDTIANDEDFRSKFETGDEATRLQMIREGGYDFTKEEALEASNGELSDEDLEAVAGGVFFTGCCIIGAAVIAVKA